MLGHGIQWVLNIFVKTDIKLTELRVSSYINDAVKPLSCIAVNVQVLLGNPDSSSIQPLFGLVRSYRIPVIPFGHLLKIDNALAWLIEEGPYFFYFELSYVFKNTM